MSNNNFEVLRAGINTSYQDQGRNNLYHIGIPFSGAMDNRNYLIANYLAGNKKNTTVIEFAYQGPLLKFNGEKICLVITGDVTFNIIKKNLNVEKGNCYQSYYLTDGDQIDILSTNKSVYGYLAVSGGFDVELFWNSCSINTKAIIFGPQRSSYTTIKDLPLKIANQIRIADKISSIEPDFVVASVLRTHLIPDMVGNTRAYLTQGFRCKECQHNMRRVPINGKCSRCEGEIITNMFKNSVTKYLGISKKLIKEHDVGNYLTNRIEMIDQEMHDTFPNIKPDERIKQQYLDKFFD